MINSSVTKNWHFATFCPKGKSCLIGTHVKRCIRRRSALCFFVCEEKMSAVAALNVSCNGNCGRSHWATTSATEKTRQATTANSTCRTTITTTCSLSRHTRSRFTIRTALRGAIRWGRFGWIADSSREISTSPHKRCPSRSTNGESYDSSKLPDKNHDVNLLSKGDGVVSRLSQGTAGCGCDFFIVLLCWLQHQILSNKKFLNCSRIS